MRKMAPWILFLACLLLIALSATPLGRTADHLAVAIRFSAVILLSILVVRRMLKEHRSQSDANDSASDRGDALLKAVTRWYRGETK